MSYSCKYESCVHPCCWLLPGCECPTFSLHSCSLDERPLVCRVWFLHQNASTFVSTALLPNNSHGPRVPLLPSPTTSHQNACFSRFESICAFASTMLGVRGVDVRFHLKQQAAVGPMRPAGVSAFLHTHIAVSLRCRALAPNRSACTHTDAARVHSQQQQSRPTNPIPHPLLSPPLPPLLPRS